MPAARTDRPQTTLKRAFLTLGVCVVLLGLVMALGTASGWLANPALGPQSVLEAIGAFLFVFALWTFNIGVFFAVFAGIPWAVLHLIGFRSWWIAPLAGFAVVFAIAFYMTTQGGHSYPELQTSTWIQGRATMIEGRLTPYGESLYGPAAAIRNGVLFGAVGAVVGFVIWRIAYRRPPPADATTEPNA